MIHHGIDCCFLLWAQTPLTCWQVGKARDHVESGVNELVQAKKYQKNTRKWMCCGLVVLLIIIAVIVVVAIRPWRYAH